jgi:hypothetical protein
VVAENAAEGVSLLDGPRACSPERFLNLRPLRATENAIKNRFYKRKLKLRCMERKLSISVRIT